MTHSELRRQKRDRLEKRREYRVFFMAIASLLVLALIILYFKS